MIKSESKFQKEVLKYLKEKGIYALNLHGDGFAGKGKPDIVACIKGQFVAFELKVGSNTMQDDQIIHMKRILRSGGKHYVPYSIEEVKRIVESLEEE